MLRYIKGVLTEVDSNRCVLDVGGMGYLLIGGKRLIKNIQENVGKEVLLWTFVRIREEEIQLFGFENALEVDFFIKLIGVSGIGPKSALSIMDLGTLDSLMDAIDNADVGYLSKAVGVGKKTAQRLVVELRGKLVDVEERSIDKELLAALKGLGYSRLEYAELVKMLPDDIEELEDKISWMLKRLGRA